MRRNSTVCFYATFLLISLSSILSISVANTSPPPPTFSDFSNDGSPSRRWLGPFWWANPLWGWRLQRGAALGTCSSPARTLCALPLSMNKGGSKFSLSAVFSFRLLPRQGQSRKSNTPSTVGFRIGRRGKLRDFRHALLYATSFVDGTVSTSGVVSLAGTAARKSLSLLPISATNTTVDIELVLTGTRFGAVVVVDLDAYVNKGQEIEQHVHVDVVLPLSSIRGGVSLLCTGPYSHIDNEEEVDDVDNADDKPSYRQVRISHFQAAGELLTIRPHRRFGPIWWTQYIVSSGVLRLQVQFAPIELPTLDNSKSSSTSGEATLSLLSDATKNRWTEVRKVPLHRETWTALFVIGVSQWTTTYTQYAVTTMWNGQKYRWAGVIRPEPIQTTRSFRLAVFSCDRGYTFPNAELTKHVRNVVRPHMLFFAGDQIYENMGNYGAPKRTVSATAKHILYVQRLDFLYKYARFGWMWRKVLRRTPAIILPDDHDVYHPNLWGAGGIRVPRGKTIEHGGYLMSGDFVSAVQRVQSGHFPTLQDVLARNTRPNRTLPLGIRPLYTAVTYGGISFAVLEDRKFKAAPLQFSSLRARETGKRGALLGTEQERFVKNWCSDRTLSSNESANDVLKTIRVALSQTIFGALSTHAGPQLSRHSYIYDTGAWPLRARARIVRLLSRCGALSIHGDQHLGMLAHLGVRKQHDGNIAFMVPGTANGWPRAWWPNGPFENNTGSFLDQAGNPVDVIAVANPTNGSHSIPFINAENPLSTAFKRGSGFGLVVFDKQRRTADVSLFHVGSRVQLSGQFDGFPKTIKLG